MADIDSGAVASREEKPEPRNDPEFVRSWLEAIEVASKEEKDWRETGDKAVNVFRSRSDKGDGQKRERTFNILHANVETIVPALYNSLPVPDIRRRFNDDDPVGREISELIERCISFSIDNYDFDSHMRAAVMDMELPGRGLSRVRYVPYFDEANENKVYEEVICEHVPWKRFRRGPAQMWTDVPWVAFELFLTREELRRLAPDVADDVDLDCNADGYVEKGDGQNVPDIYKRAHAWEIWDKESRKVIFIAPSYNLKPIYMEDDPLGLTGFFPLPRPLYAIETSDTLVPVTPYEIYRDQAEELERISRRIMVLINALKARGVYDGRMEEIGRLAKAEDNELIPIESAMVYADGGGLEKGILWFPVQVIAVVVEKLYIQREQIKQAIYEITGIADILRGSTNPNETLGAQQLKAQWGSLRIQRKQAEVQRYARDLFRLKAEIIATKFSFETIMMMTGQKYPSMQEKQMAQQAMAQMQQAVQAQQSPPQGQPGQGQPQGQSGPQGGNVVPMRPQAPPPDPTKMKEIQEILSKPSREEIERVLRDDLMRAYRIDVETDSTVRADMTRNVQMMTQFLQGTAQYMQAMGPAVQAGYMGAPEAVAIFASFARNFRLGKQAEDALDKLKEKAESFKPPSPDEGKKEAMQAEMEFRKQETAMRQQEAQGKFQIEQQRLGMEQQDKAARLQMDAADLQARRDAEAEQRAINESSEMTKNRIEQRKLELLEAEHEFKKAIEFERLEIERGKLAITAKAQEEKHEERNSKQEMKEAG
jgi:hypothetical protein